MCFRKLKRSADPITNGTSESFTMVDTQGLRGAVYFLAFPKASYSIERQTGLKRRYRCAFLNLSESLPVCPLLC